MNELGNGPWDKNYKPSGISKAEEAALKAYPPKRKEVSMTGAIYTVVGGDFERRIFQEGYETVEKDLALTWEDIKTIEQIIATSDWYDFEISDKLWSQEFYEEVLKRFKEAKR